MGDGKSLSVSTDAWLRAKEGHRIDEQYVNSVWGLKVCDLFMSSSNEWDATKVHNLFSSRDAEYILVILVPKNQFQDRIVWIHALDGNYSAKIG